MPSEVAHRVDTGETHPVVRLAGVLDAASAPQVRAVVLDVLAAEPAAAVLDVSALRVADPGAVAVLRQVARETVDWPATRLVLCTGPGDTAWRATGLPLRRDEAAALRELGAPDASRRLRLDLEPLMGAARRARELVTEACGRWEHRELAGPACIIVTEMVNNVVAHAHTPMTVLIGDHGDAMTVAVRDGSGKVPKFTGGPVSPTSYGGRGLLLIDTVSSRWGSLELDDPAGDGGKVVWAVLDHDPGDPTELVHRAGMARPAKG